MAAPQPDPRLFEKNFAMPMNAASVGEAEIGPVRRKEGSPAPRAIVPEYGGRTEDPNTIRRRDKNETPSLLPTLNRKPDGSRTVTVSEGRVIEVIPRFPADSIVEHPIDGIWNKPEDGPTNLLKEHDITTGQYVGVAYSVNKFGDILIDPDELGAIRKPRISVTSDPPSGHYTPPVGQDPGAPGDCFYILAQLVGTGNSEKLEIWHGGSNIDYVHDTPPFLLDPAATGADIFKKYDILAGIYNYFGLLAETPLEVTQFGDDLKFRWTPKADLDLIVKTYTLEATTVTIPITFTVPAQTVTTAYEGEHTHAATIPKAAFAGILVAGQTDPAQEDGIGDDSYSAHSHMIGAVNSAVTQEPYADVPFTLVAGGAHSHTFTVPAQTITATISVPGEPLKIPDTDYYTLCWRKGIFVGKYDNAAALPAATPDGDGIISKTLWILNLDDLLTLDLADTSNPNITVI